MGNYDVRNVGYKFFEDFIGFFNGVYEFRDGVVIWVDLIILDLSDGRIGGYKFCWFKERFEEYFDRRFKIVVVYYYFVLFFDIGRERNVLFNVGDVLDFFLRYGVILYICGYKYVLNVYCVEDFIIDNVGCILCKKIRKGDVNSYNIIEFYDDGRVRVIIRCVMGDEIIKEYKFVKFKIFVFLGRRFFRIV